VHFIASVGVTNPKWPVRAIGAPFGAVTPILQSPIATHWSIFCFSKTNKKFSIFVFHINETGDPIQQTRHLPEIVR